MLEEAVGILAVASIRRTARGLRIGNGKRLGTEHAQKGLRRHGARAYFDVIRLLQHASTLGPERLQTKEEFLKGKSAGCLQSHGWILNQAFS